MIQRIANFYGMMYLVGAKQICAFDPEDRKRLYKKRCQTQLHPRHRHFICRPAGLEIHFALFPTLSTPQGGLNTAALRARASQVGRSRFFLWHSSGKNSKI
jgi:hypothetical protein